MASEQSSIKWNQFTSCPIETITNVSTNVPSGIDKNNYIVIDSNFGEMSIYKYNIESDKWIKIDFKKPGRISTFSSFIDVTNQILYLFQRKSATQIQLNNNNIITNKHNIEIDYSQATGIICVK